MTEHEKHWPTCCGMPWKWIIVKVVILLVWVGIWLAIWLHLRGENKFEKWNFGPWMMRWQQRYNRNYNPNQNANWDVNQQQPTAETNTAPQANTGTN